MAVTEFDARAQTNIQLYAQLLDAGHSAREILSVRDAYALAAQLFAGQLRPEGRPFVCHAVGVASILAMVDVPLPMIAGGLLHSAYTHGDFGLGRGETHRTAHARLRAVIGAEIEALAAGYSRLPWNVTSIPGFIANASALAADVRQIIVIRLANEIEDALDAGLELSRKAEDRHRAIAVDDLTRLAAAVGYPRLALALRSALDSGRSANDIATLRESRQGSYLVCPASWRERWFPRLVRFGRRLRAAL